MNFTVQQQAAIDKKGRIIVSADAGSGKTAVMIERLVSLILGGADVREVLCVTFTKKAASQLRDKLRDALLERIAKGEERARLEEQLKELPLAEIGTIHSFCGRLIRTNFFLAGTDASFRIISPDDAEGAALKGRALDRVFERAYAERDSGFYLLLSSYFRGKKDAALRKIVKDLHKDVRGLADYREILSHAGEDVFDRAAGDLFESYRRRAVFMLDGLEERKQLIAGFGARAENVRLSVSAACSALAEADGLFGMRRCVLPEIPSMPATTKAQGETLAALRFLSAASRDVKAMYKQLGCLSDEAQEREYFADGAARARALAALVLAFDEELSVLKREANVLDYDDLEHLALKAIENEEGRKSLKERYRYVFVDEYQDVNPVQEKIVSLIAGEEVFLVGDSKQAIYGFRGSSTAFFENKRAQLRENGGDLPLSKNFRSAPAILDAVNAVFLPLLHGFRGMVPCDRYGDRCGEVIFHRIGKEKKEETAARGVYSVLERTGEEQLGFAVKEQSDPMTQRIAAIIEEELTKTVYDADRKTERKTEFSDIAVLVRKKSGEAERLVRELERRKIPVATAAKVNVCDFSEARLVIDVLSYLDDAEQDIPLASAMLSALGGFNEEELAAIRLRYRKVYNFRDACAYVANTRREGDALASKMRAFFGKMADLRARAQIFSAQEMLGILLSEGLEAQIAAMPQGRLRLARVRRLFAEAGQTGGVHDFLSRLKSAGYCVLYAGGGGENAVQIMTMHASKGLEFPVVILADLDVAFHGAEKDETMWTERYLICPKSFDTDKKIVHETILRYASAALQDEEERVGERNLLYVAMTRAKYRLHMIFGEPSSRAISPEYANRMSDFVDLAAGSSSFCGSAPSEREPVERHALAGKADPSRVEEILRVRRAVYPHPESVLLPVKSSASELMRQETDAKPRGGGHTVEEGLAYHAFLEHVRFGHSAEEELSRMARENILTEDELAILDAAKLENILALPSLKEAAGARIRREQTFLIALPASEMYDTAAGDEVLFQGAIDLLLEGEDGYTVVDYKYSARGDEEIKEHYAVQIKLYKKAVARALRVKESAVKARIVNIALCREIGM